MPVILPATEISVIRPGDIHTFKKSEKQTNSPQAQLITLKNQAHNLNSQPRSLVYFPACNLRTQLFLRDISRNIEN